MNYSSLSFILFIALTLVAYFALPLKKNQWIVLLVASYVFYLFAGYQYAAYLLFTTISTYVIARWLDHVSQAAKDTLKRNKKEWDRETKNNFKKKSKKKKRLIMALALILNFGLLAFLKYYNFLAGSLNDVFGVFGMGFSIPTLNLLLPLGISFYTFQSMGYVVDVYREKFPAERNIAKFALFVSFFPQIIQGPISFYHQLAPQLYKPRQFNFTKFKYGCELILWGFFKKLVIADRAVIAINTVVSDYHSYTGIPLLFTVFLFAFQLYADFSGGIDISRGVAQMLGIELVENFRRPYFSRSISEYWRRWHITLGAWMREYLFYPLAMSGAFLSASKKMKATRFGATGAGAHIAKVLPTSVASLIVFLVVGIWHGASWKYVAFGIWNGGIIMISILMKPLFESALRRLHIRSKSLGWVAFQIIRTFLIVCVGYVFDIAPSFRLAVSTFVNIWKIKEPMHFLGQIFALGINEFDLIVLIFGLLVLFAVSLIQEKSGKSLRVMIDRKPFIVECVCIIVGVLLIASFGVYGPEYNPADFVYAQF